jgi:hypothetical protein
VAWDGFLAWSVPYSVVGGSLGWIWICIVIDEDIHTFMYLGIIGEYAKSLFASSPCMHRSFPRVLRICLNTSRAYGDDFVYRK